MPHRRNPASAIVLAAVFMLAACADRQPTAPAGPDAPGLPTWSTSPSSASGATISAGDTYSLAVASDGGVVHWGRGDLGRAPVPAGTATGVAAISAGYYHALALKEDGSVVAWGYNASGQATVPTAANDSIVAIAAGSFHSMALKSDGTIVAWGWNNHGQTTVPFEANDSIVAVAAGEWHSLALRSDGGVVAWGNEENGWFTVPAEAASGVVAISAGREHSVALKDDGTVVVWGRNYEGEWNVPPDANGSIVAISAGGAHTLGLTTGGGVVTWGYGGHDLTPVPEAANDSIVAVSAGYLHSLALKSDGTVIGWGTNGSGETTVPPGLVARTPDGQPSNGAPSASLVITSGTFSSGVGLDSVAVGSRVYFDAGGSSDADGSIATYAFSVPEDDPPATNTRTVPTYTRRFDSPGSYTMQVTVTDNGGATSTAAKTLTVVPSRAPVAVIANGASVTLREGQALRLLSTGTSDPDPNQTLSYHWSFGDGKASTLANPNKVFADEGVYTVVLTVSDNAEVSDTATLQVTVENTSPRATFGAPTTANEGSAYTLRLTSAADSGATDMAAGLQFAFDCGDGNGYGDYSTTASRACAAAPDEGSRTLRAKVRDKDKAETEYTKSLAIANVPPTSGLGYGGTEVMPHPRAGRPIPFVAGFSDPGASDGPWRLVYVWGDGTRTVRTATTQGMQAEVTHTYAEPGTYSVFVQVRDADGAVRNSRTLSVQVDHLLGLPF